MDRLACVDLPAFPLQLLLKEHPEWRRFPAAVVTQDTPQGTLLWVNERAQGLRVLPGLRYAAGLSLAADLRAGVIDRSRIEQGVASVTEALRGFTPEVEPSAELPGVFWLNAGGLTRLYPSLLRWTDAIRSGLGRFDYQANVAAGFTRFGTYALARAHRGAVIFEDPAQERSAVRQVPIERLDLDPGTRDALQKLGLTTVGGFLDLPAAGIRKRFGEPAYRLYRLAAGEAWSPFQPRPPEEAVEQRLLLDHPIAGTEPLLFIIRQMIPPMLSVLAGRVEALAELLMAFSLDSAGFEPGETLTESIRPAAPTLDALIIVDLVRLRLESVKPRRGIVEIRLTAVGAPATHAQVKLFVENPRRSLDAANRALARVRAEFGSQAVVRAELSDGHLPEARFRWLPLEELGPARPRSVLLRPLVRRIFERPVPLPSRPRYIRDDAWSLRDLDQGPVVKAIGPDIVSGGWWVTPIDREYYYMETERGDLLWIYYDHRRRRWFLHGRVE